MTAHGHLRAAIVLAAVCLAAPAALGQQAGWVAFGSGAEVRGMRMHIGFGRSLVVMDLMVYENQKDAPEVLQFFETDMEQIILSIRRARG